MLLQSCGLARGAKRSPRCEGNLIEQDLPEEVLGLQGQLKAFPELRHLCAVIW